jgi:hypothetical protein
MTRPITVSRPGRISMRTLAVLGVATVCVIPTADAWASSHHGNGRAARPAAAPVARPAAQWAWGQTLHGDLVMPSRTGTRTVTLQRGVIATVKDSTITVKSSDGFTTTWTVTDGTAVTGRGARRRRPHPVTSPTGDSPTLDAAAAVTSAPTDGLAAGQQIQIWGTTSGVTSSIASGSSATASALIVVRQAPRTPAPSATTSTPDPTTPDPTTTEPTTTEPTVTSQ